MADKTWEEKNFTEKLWTFDEKVLIQRFIVGHQKRDTGDAHTALTILQAKAAIAAQDTAKATRQLAYATFALAALTLALVLIEVFGIHAGSEPSAPAPTVSAWPTGTGTTSGTTPSTGSKSSTSPGHSSTTKERATPAASPTVKP